VNNNFYLFKIKILNPKKIIKKSILLLKDEYFEHKNKINLENVEFEKEFDVYGESQIESRETLTSSFMYKILNFINKTDKKRVYEFFFL